MDLIGEFALCLAELASLELLDLAKQKNAFSKEVLQSRNDSSDDPLSSHLAKDKEMESYTYILMQQDLGYVFTI